MMVTKEQIKHVFQKYDYELKEVIEEHNFTCFKYYNKELDKNRGMHIEKSLFEDAIGVAVHQIEHQLKNCRYADDKQIKLSK